MRGALITEVGRLPEAADLPEPEGEGVVVEVLAAALNPLDVNVAAGRFYGGHPPLPYVPGAECVGRVDGRLVWVFGGGFGLSRDGGMAERALAPAGALHDVPEDADPALACALGIAGLAGWLPLAWRAPVRLGETVLVLGATGTVGAVAVQAAKVLGAGRVLAAGRDEEGLSRALELGADRAVRLDELAGAIAEEQPSYVVDPLWGPVVEAVVAAVPPRTRIVNLGQSAGPEATLTSAAVRGKELELIGFSDFAVPAEDLQREHATLVRHAAEGRIRVDLERVPLDGVGDAWRRQSDGSAQAKLVLVP